MKGIDPPSIPPSEGGKSAEKSPFLLAQRRDSAGIEGDLQRFDTQQIAFQTPSEVITPARSAIFLDRDGVLNQEASYIYVLEDLKLIPGAAQAVRQINDRGIFCCLVSNQSGPARGFYPASHVDALHDRLCHLLQLEAGAHLDALYYCPYLGAPEGGTNPKFTGWSTWRKPNTGMLVAAAWEHDLDLNRSFMVGDKATDIDLAHNAGCTGVLVQTGFGDRVLSGSYQHSTIPDYIAPDLAAAVNWILQQPQLTNSAISTPDGSALLSSGA